MEKIKENVLLCGVVKDCERSIAFNIEKAMQTMELFSNAKLVVYENNSKDNTKSLLQVFSNRENVVIISEDIDYETIKKNSRIWAYKEITGSDHPCRIEQICNARNRIIKEINKSKYDDYTYIIWIDLDSRGWDLTGIQDSFLKKEHWDVVFANGLDNSKKYYDMYALRKEDENVFGPELMGDIFWYQLGKKHFSISPEEDRIIPVYSAFGGIGIYKKKIFRDNHYDCIVNDDVKEFYENLLFHKGKTEMLYTPFTEPCSKFPYGLKDNETGIFWKSNSGYDKPVVCEHVCLNLGLINKEYRLGINPKMIYYHC